MHKILRNKANQGGEFLNTENNKILIKETEHDSRKRGRFFMVFGYEDLISLKYTTTTTILL